MREKYSRRKFIKTISYGSAGLLSASALSPLVNCQSESSSRRPNIILIMADDMGFSDIGCFGGEIHTPNLDSLAQGGVRFTQFYNTGRCCPTRASLLTGLYPHQAGVGLMVYKDRGKGYKGHLNNQCVTFGDVLKESGYQTQFVGKWHAGHIPTSLPEFRGFDQVTGVYTHIDSYWKILKDCDVYRDRELFIPAGENPQNPYHPEKEFYTTDFFTDCALDYIDQAKEFSSKPFLLHLCYNAPHFPLEAPDKLINKYKGKYIRGWDQMRVEKLQKMKEMKLVSQKQKLPRIKGFDHGSKEGFDFSVPTVTRVLSKWNSLSAHDQEELDFRRAIYAAQIERLDWNIGRIIKHLKKKHSLDNTLILFFSDNGCSGELTEFGMNWDKYTSENYRQWKKLGGWSVSQGQCWASFSNTPLRKYKIFVHEGGISTPFIAHWPHGIKQKGTINTSQVFHIIDIMPTLCALTGAKYPMVFKDREIIPLPGKSMLPYLKNTNRHPFPRTLFWQHETCAAVRKGDWKLVSVFDRDKNAWKLHNLSEDRSETVNLIEKNPGIAAELNQLWMQWAEKIHVLPFPENRDTSKSLWPPEF